MSLSNRAVQELHNDPIYAQLANLPKFTIRESGRIAIRIPKVVHVQLVQEAKDRRTSLQKLCLAKILYANCADTAIMPATASVEVTDFRIECDFGNGLYWINESFAEDPDYPGHTRDRKVAEKYATHNEAQEGLNSIIARYRQRRHHEFRIVQTPAA